MRPSSLVVRIPPSFEAEKTYVFDVLLDEWLGFEVEIEVDEELEDYQILLPNGGCLTIQDSFFSRFEAGQTYLDRRQISRSVVFGDEALGESIRWVGLYGDERVLPGEGTVYLGTDVIASAFFMLSRWEEHVVDSADAHGRFPAEAALACQQGFLDRPVVNEYADLLMHAFRFLGFDGRRREHRFELMLTVDIDRIWRWPTPGEFIRSTLRDLSRSFDPLLLARSTKRYLAGEDPFDTFDLMMESAEEKGIRCHFFMLIGCTTQFDDLYKPDEPVRALLQRIHARGHHIGFHPSYAAGLDDELWAQEHRHLQRLFDQPILTGRSHYLRFKVPDTWQLWEDHGMSWDSTMSYPDQLGFRCGACLPFPVFNILSRRRLRLVEKPLTVMDGTLVDYLGLTPEAASASLARLHRTVASHNGLFVLLWHNSSFNVHPWHRYHDVFEKALANAPVGPG